jgi:hypothetical protein
LLKILGAKLLGAKVLRTEEGVQLIVFFAAIREILKREIYGGDKRHFCLVKTKGQFDGRAEPWPRITNPENSLCECRSQTEATQLLN